MTIRRGGLSLLASFLVLSCTAYTIAQTRPRITSPVNDEERSIIPNSQLGTVAGATDQGAVAEEALFEHMVILLKRSPEQERALRTLLDAQQTRGSKDYHAWLTPDELARRFGPASEDVAKVADWLAAQGFQVERSARSGLWIEYSGNAAQVDKAFRTRMRRYAANGESHLANASEISVPAAIAPLVAGVPLNDFFSKPLFVKKQGMAAQPLPAITAPWNNSIRAVVPGDFAIVYDILPLYKAGFDGKGQTVAVLGEADIDLSDVRTFQSIFGLPANAPTIEHVGADPGQDIAIGYGLEATLDTEWSAAVAPEAVIDLVVASPTLTSDPIALAALYTVDHNLAQIISVSYGECEQDLGAAGNALWSSLWEQAAAQGISVVVASGDQGSVACNAGGLNDLTGYGPMAVNGIASTPFNTAVGGTEFQESVNGGQSATFWNSSNGPNLASATGYIPEMVWNDSCGDLNNIYEGTECGSNLPSLAASGGGVSTMYSAPSWQTLNVTGLNILSGYSLPNQPGVIPRGIPDISLAASNAHDGFLLCFTANNDTPDCQLTNGAVTQSTFQHEGGGTSFSAPAFAGIMAILNQHEQNANPASSSPDGQQGLANPMLYALAAAETYAGCNSSSRTNPAQPAAPSCTFNDISFGNNGPPQI